MAEQIKVLLKCSVKGCPRTKRIDWDKDFPIGTVVVTLKCPWHEDGDFDTEQFYDKDGKELYWQPEEERKGNSSHD